MHSPRITISFVSYNIDLYVPIFLTLLSLSSRVEQRGRLGRVQDEISREK